MEVRPGYKQTEVGMIPENWGVRLLGALATTVASGKTKPKSIHGTYSVHGSTGVIGYADSADYEGDAVLVARVGANAGRLNCVSGEYGVTDNTIIVRLGADSCLDFYFRQLESKRLNNMVFGSGQPLITGTQLKTIALCSPPLPEQRAIATALSDVDALIASLDRLIAKKCDMKQAAMQELLTGKRRLPGFSGEWASSKIDKIFNVSTGGGKLICENTQGQFFIIEMGSITEEGRLLSNKKTMTETNMLLLDDLVMPTRDIGEGKIIGKVAIIDKNNAYVLGNNVYRLMAKNISTNARYFYYLINSNRINTALKKKVAKSVQLALNKRFVEEQEVIFPNQREEQTAIATILSDMDIELAALEQKLDKTRLLKQGMMQELLTGRIRLV